MSDAIDFNKNVEFTYGEVDRLSPMVRRVIANNPGPFTFTGTGTYVVGNGRVAVIDPGPADQQHIDAIMRATSGETITHILVTHRHIDHSPGCEMLKALCDAETWAYPRTNADGESGFGIDTAFEPDHTVVGGDVINGGDWQLQCLYTPGQASDHLSFFLSDEHALFCGDIVMGWSTTIVSPPDGSMSAYMSSLKHLMERTDAVYYPTHGAPIPDPQSYVGQLYQHRRDREDQVISCIRDGADSLAAMVPVVYVDLDPAMYGAASRSLLATIEYLVESGRLSVTGKAVDDAVYHIN